MEAAVRRVRVLDDGALAPRLYRKTFSQQVNSPRQRMYTTKTHRVHAIRFLEEGSHNVRMRQLIGHEDGALKTSMHELIVGKGGYSAKHKHAWDHQLVVTKGRGVALVDRKRVT